MLMHMSRYPITKIDSNTPKIIYYILFLFLQNMWLLEPWSLWSLWKYPKHLRGHLCEPIMEFEHLLYKREAEEEAKDGVCWSCQTKLNAYPRRSSILFQLIRILRFLFIFPLKVLLGVFNSSKKQTKIIGPEVEFLLECSPYMNSPSKLHA